MSCLWRLPWVIQLTPRLHRNCSMILSPPSEWHYRMDTPDIHNYIEGREEGRENERERGKDGGREGWGCGCVKSCGMYYPPSFNMKHCPASCWRWRGPKIYSIDIQYKMDGLAEWYSCYQRYWLLLFSKSTHFQLYCGENFFLSISSNTLINMLSK